MWLFSQRSVGTWGLTGLDRLLCFMIVQELQNIIIYLARNVFQDKAMMDVLSKFTKEMQPLKTIIGACAWLRVMCTSCLPLKQSAIFTGSCHWQIEISCHTSLYTCTVCTKYMPVFVASFLFKYVFFFSKSAKILHSSCSEVCQDLARISGLHS